MAFPKDDPHFEDVSIAQVTEESGGWSIKRSDGWSFFVDGISSAVEPKVGMAARFYGDGIGRPVRGVYLGGKKVFYRTEAEDEAYQDRQMYGADAAEWLARWDSGRSVWSIEMGGLGPGYEQCIHITAAEILRHLLTAKYDTASWSAPPEADAKAAWKRDRDAIEKYGFANETIKDLGLSGAQWGAAMNVALNLYQRGPITALTDERIKDRKIQVSRDFPGQSPAPVPPGEKG